MCFVRWKQTNLFLSFSLCLSFWSQWFQCVNSEQGSCFQAGFCPGHVVSSPLRMTLQCVTLYLSPRPPFDFDLLPFICMCHSSLSSLCSSFLSSLSPGLPVSLFLSFPVSHAMTTSLCLLHCPHFLLSLFLCSLFDLLPKIISFDAFLYLKLFLCVKFDHYCTSSVIASCLCFFCYHYYIISNQISGDAMIDRPLIIMGQYLVIGNRLVVSKKVNQKVRSDAASLDSLIYYLVLSFSSSLYFSLSLSSCFCFKSHKFFCVMSFWRLRTSATSWS